MWTQIIPIGGVSGTWNDLITADSGIKLPTTHTLSLFGMKIDMGEVKAYNPNADKLAHTILKAIKHEAYKNYVYWCEDQKIRPETNRKLGRSIKRLIPSANLEKRPGGREDRTCSYEFPPLTKARKEFEDAYKAIDLIPWNDNNLKTD